MTAAIKESIRVQFRIEDQIMLLTINHIKGIEKVDIFIEVGSIKIPKKKADLRNLLLNADTFSRLACLHHKQCTSTGNNPKAKAPAMCLSQFEELMEVNKQKDN